MDKPPRSTRYQPGRSGNPRGRPKASNDFAVIYRQLSNEMIPTISNGKRTKVPAFKAMLLRLRQIALSGDIRAMKEFLEMEARLEPEQPETNLTTAEWNDLLAEQSPEALAVYREIISKEKTIRDQKRKRKTSNDKR